MRTLSICVLFLFVFSRVKSLELNEAGQFFNSRRYGGFVSVTENENSYIIVSNGLPDHAPDSLTSQPVIPRNNIFSVPKNPTIAEKPGCLPMGPIGISRTGVVIFNPLNIEGQNAVEGDTAEQLDQCNGHPDPMGVYHYHALPKNCLYKGEEDELIGVARDGFPIYGPMASDLRREVMNSDLDKCHGRFVNGQYRYHATSAFPYFMGCLRGSIPRRMDEATKSCNETSAFDDQWGYLCACGPNTMEIRGQGRFPPGLRGDGSPRPIGFIPGQGQDQFGRRQMFAGPMIGGQMSGQVVIGPNGQLISTGNQIQIGPNGQIVNGENQLQFGPNGQIIGRGNKIQVDSNGQIMTSGSQLQVGPNGNPIQMPILRGPGVIQGQGPRPLGFLPTQQGDGTDQSNGNQGQSQIPRPLGFLSVQQQQPEGEQVSVGQNGQIVNSGSQIGPNRNPIQMPIMTGPGAIQGQGPRPLGFLTTQQGDRTQQSNGNQGQSQIPRPLGFLPTQQQPDGDQLSIGPNGQIVNSRSQIGPNRNPIQMPIMTGSGAIQGQGPRSLGFLPTQQGDRTQQSNGNRGQSQIPRPLGFLPTQQQPDGDQLSIGPNGQIVNSRSQIGPTRNPIQMPIMTGPGAIQGQGPRPLGFLPTQQGDRTQQSNGNQGQSQIPTPLGFLPTQQQPDGEQLSIGPNGQIVNSGSQVQIGPNRNPIQMPIMTGPGAIQGQGPRPLGFLPTQQGDRTQQTNGNQGQSQIPRPLGFLPTQQQRVNGASENGEQPRFVNGIQQIGEQPLPIFVNGVAQNPDQPMTRLVRTQNGQVVPVLVNSGSQNGQTLTVPRIARPMGNNGMFQRRPFGQPPIPFLTPNGGVISTTNQQIPGQSPMAGPPFVQPNVNGMVIGSQGQGRFQPTDSQPSSNAATQGQIETIEGLEILDKSTQENRQETTNSLFRQPFDGQRQRIPGFTQYGGYRLFNMYLENKV